MNNLKVALTIRQCVADLKGVLEGRTLESGKVAGAIKRLAELANKLEENDA